MVDAQIEKETARQRQDIQGSPRARPRAGSRPLSPSRRPRRDGQTTGRSTPLEKTLDPADFDQDFVIGDSEQPTRVGTPVPKANGDGPSVPPKENGPGAQGSGDKPEGREAGGAVKYADLPSDIQLRLKKLDRLEPRYRDLVASYRIAHEKAVAVDAFETALREHTPLASIQDPGALIEFLQQSELKSSMVMNELRRTMTECESLRKKVETMESGTKDKSSEAKLSEEGKEDSEDFFSYESELPRLQKDVKDYVDRVTQLETENGTLKEELQASKESLERITRDLKASSKELTASKDDQPTAEDETYKNKLMDLEGELKISQDALTTQQSEVSKHQSTIKSLKDQLSRAKENEPRSKGLDQKVQRLEKDLTETRELVSQQEKHNATLNNLVQSLRNQIKATESSIDHPKSDEPTPEPTSIPEPVPNTASAASKRKKNKKKKAGKAAEGPDQPSKTEEEATATESADTADTGKLALLQQELDSLHSLCEDKDATIERMQNKLKDQEALQEEIETLRDDIVHYGQETVEAKDKIKELLAERAALQETITKLEEHAGDLRAQQDSHADTSNAHQTLVADFSNLKRKSDTLETELSTAEKLAASRFKDLTDMRDILQRAQPELQSLRSEVIDLRKSKEELMGKATVIKKLEAREKDLRNEIGRYKKQLSDKDLELKDLSEKLSQVNTGRREVDDVLRRTQRDLTRAQHDRKDALDTKDKATKELSKSQDDLQSANAAIQRLEQQVAKLTADAQGVKDEITLKTAQYASAQSLMNSMQDETQEIGTQMKEVRERCESLEEELADAHRLLSERSREGEKLRRLASEAEGRAESRIKDMREQLDLAVEERDRAEEQSSTMGRKRTRELEELKAKVRDSEIALRRAEQEKEELEITDRDIRRQKDEFERRSIRSNDELKEVREAMSQIREALDETEKQTRELEKEKSTLKQSLDETQHQLDKIQKSSKTMTEEVKTLKQQLGQSSRSSIESTRSPGRFASPPPRNVISSAGQSSSSQGKIDYVYLKNVLLQFMEQKDRKHQVALVPVLGMLLQFDK